MREKALMGEREVEWLEGKDGWLPEPFHQSSVIAVSKGEKRDRVEREEVRG